MDLVYPCEGLFDSQGVWDPQVENHLSRLNFQWYQDYNDIKELCADLKSKT